MENITKYPVGVQKFDNLRSRGNVYVDKTAYIYKLINKGSFAFFLSRPRRFGKSLFLNTLECFFRGKKELFQGLFIYDYEKKWKSYPVIHIDFSRAEADKTSTLSNFIENRLKEYEKEYHIRDTSEIESIGERFGTIIERIHKKTRSKVVILIDEFDKGIHEVLENAEQLKENQEILRPFFTQIKAQEEHVHFCMITGVARFRHYTLFSGFNNLDDISMDEEYASICGITMNELRDHFQEGIQTLAEKYKNTFEQCLQELRLKYDGYRFTDSNELVFNPFSIIKCLSDKKIANYWVKSGTSKVFVDYLTNSNYNLLSLEELWVTQDTMEGAYSKTDPIPLLFQTGYLTIKDGCRGYYRLGIPNGEVRFALIEELIPRYNSKDKEPIPNIIIKMGRALETGNVEEIMSLLKKLLASIPYHELDLANIEKTYHLSIYELFLILGIDTPREVAMSGGRIDMVVQNHNFVYVFEFKLDGTPKEALDQIDDRGYAIPWSAEGRTVYKIGVVFSSKTRTIDTWQPVKYDEISNRSSYFKR